MPKARQHIRAQGRRPGERALAQERNNRNGKGNGRVDGKPPRQRNDAVPVRERSEHYEACDTPEREAAGGSAVAVDRSERAGRERREELAERRRDENSQSAAGDMRRAKRQIAGDQVAER